MRALAVLAVLTASLVGGGVTSSASASPLCEVVWTDGTILGVHALGDCLPFGGQTLCPVNGAGAYPQADVYIELCLPAIVAGPSPAP